MALNQKIEEILTTNSQFQLKIDQLEIQVNSVTNFLKQQFGDDFELSSAYSYSAAKANGYPVKPVSSAEHHQQPLTEEQMSNCNHTNEISNIKNNNKMVEIANSTTVSKSSTKSATSTATTSARQEHQQCFVIIEKQELHNFTMEEEKYLVDVDVTEEDDDNAAIKVELNPLELEQMSPGSTTDSELNDPFADFSTKDTVCGNIEQQRQKSSLQQKTSPASKRKKPFVCSWRKCRKRFADRSNFKAHERIHTGEKPFMCRWEGCGLRFTKSYTLTIHKRTHTGDKPYICDWEGCARQFGDRSTLVRHKRTHTGEKPYICDWKDCGQRFSFKCVLVCHKRTHTGEKPFICKFPGCEKGFATRRCLIRHERTHTCKEPFICDEPGCGKQFKRLGNLLGHKLRSHQS